MSENSKFSFRMYSATGEGIIDYGYHQNAMSIVEVVEGCVNIQLGTDSVLLEVGDFIFIPSGLVYRMEASASTASVRVLCFSSSIIEDGMDNFDTEIFYMFYVQSRTKITVFKPGHPIYENLVFCMSEAYEEYLSKDVCYKLPMKANVYLMMTSLLRYYCGSKNELARMIYHNVMRMRPVLDYMDENYSEKIYIETLSDMITVSPDYFTKMFKDSIGKTPIDYINSIRINHALRLLSMTDTPISEIAEHMGFSNPNYFHKIFKQYMNTSPLAYRKGIVK